MNLTRYNNKGFIQITFAIFSILAIMIFVLASPILNEIINLFVGSMSPEVAFIIRLMPWFILTLLIFVAYVTFGGSN